MHKSSKSLLDPRQPRGILLLTVLSGLVAIPAGVLAQSSQHRMMVFEDDSGSGPQVLHFTGPDFGDLRKPDFVRRDLPIFREELELDGVQHAIVQVLLDAYLDAFKVLVKQGMPQNHFTLPGMNMNIDGDHPGHQDADPEHIDDLVREALQGADGLTDIDIDADGSGNVVVWSPK